MPENENLRAGSFDALICTVGHTYISPWKDMTDKEFGDIPVRRKQLECGFRKSLFGANTGQVIKPH